MLRRSNIGLSSVQHRLLAGMCIADLFNSFGHIFANVSTPSDVKYIVWAAHGNLFSCILNGFFTTYGFYMAPLYNCALNLYYLAVVKYEKTEEYIESKLERYFHGFPHLISFAVCITLFANKSFNSDLQGNCTGQCYNPPHCAGYEAGVVREGFKIACNRGCVNGDLLFLTFLFTLMIVSPVIIGSSLALIYAKVRELKKKMGKYGKASFSSQKPPEVGIRAKIKTTFSPKKR